jgi:hypothetical protein
MNAYELADILQEYYDDFDGSFPALEKSIVMLRQQADRIAELEKVSKPVAWMEYIQDEEWEVWYIEPTDLPKGHTYKPLYTSPQIKELSDEEIIILRQDTNPKTTDNWADTLSFARALLKKASEK